MTLERAEQIMKWVAESVGLEAIGEYCAIMDCGESERKTAMTRVVTGTMTDFGRAQVEQAQRVIAESEKP